MPSTLTPITTTAGLLATVEQTLQTQAVPKAGCGLGALRWKALEKAEALGLPTSRQEAWRFTNLRPLLETTWQAYPTSAAVTAQTEGCATLVKQAKLFSEANAPLRLVFINGQFAAALSNWHPGVSVPEGLQLGLLSNTEALPGASQQTLQNQINQALNQTEEGLEAAMQALASEGLYIELAPGTHLQRPIEVTHLVQEQAEPTLAPLRLLVNAGANSQLTLGVQGLGQADNSPALAYLHSSFQVQAGAVVNHSQAWQPATHSLGFSHTQVQTAGEAATYRLVQLATGGAMHHHSVNAVLNGKQAHVGLFGLQALSEKTQLHQQVTMVHAVPEATSEQRFKALLDDESKAEFAGRIWVKQDAQQTNAEQLVKALLLSPKAKAFTRPWLNIDADDVKCSHGATVGQLSEDELFYLASRGLGESVARCLLTYGFAADVLQEETHLELRKALTQRTLEALGLSNNPAFCFTTCSKHL